MNLWKKIPLAALALLFAVTMLPACSEESRVEPEGVLGAETNELQVDRNGRLEVKAEMRLKGGGSQSLNVAHRAPSLMDPETTQSFIQYSENGVVRFEAIVRTRPDELDVTGVIDGQPFAHGYRPADGGGTEVEYSNGAGSFGPLEILPGEGLTVLQQSEWDDFESQTKGDPDIQGVTNAVLVFVERPEFNDADQAAVGLAVSAARGEVMQTQGVTEELDECLGEACRQVGGEWTDRYGWKDCWVDAGNGVYILAQAAIFGIEAAACVAEFLRNFVIW